MPALSFGRPNNLNEAADPAATRRPMTMRSTNLVEIRDALYGDLHDVHSLRVRAFGRRSQEAVLIDLLHRAENAAVSLLAVDAGTIVGHVVFSPMEIDPPRHDLKILAMGPVGVLPENQRRGIGSQLIRAGIDACRQAGVDAVAVLGGPQFYGRFGFQPAMGHGLSNEYVQDEHFMILELRQGRLHGARGLMKYAPESRAAGC